MEINGTYVQFTADPYAEKILDKHKVNYCLEVVRCDAIDFSDNPQFQPRFTKIDEAQCHAYAQDIKFGDEFPAPVLVRLSNGKFTVGGGNHRCKAACESGLEILGAYVIEPMYQDDMLNLAFDLNSGNGLAQSEEERVAMALRGLDSGYFSSARDAANWCKVSDQKVTTARAVRDTHRRATTTLPRNILTAFEGMPTTNQHRLGSIESDSVFAKAVEVVTTHKLGTGAINELLRDLKGLSASGDAAKLELLSNFKPGNKKDEKAEDKKGKGMDAFTRFRAGSGNLLKLNEVELFGAITNRTESERAAVMVDLNSVIAKLTMLVEKLRQEEVSDSGMAA